MNRQSTNNVYVYHAYNDDYAFGEMETKVFATRELAREHLRSSVEEYFDSEWEKIPSEEDLQSDDTFTADYVSISTGDGTLFWTITKLPVES